MPKIDFNREKRATRRQRATRVAVFATALACTGCATTLGYVPAYPRPGNVTGWKRMLPKGATGWEEVPSYGSVHRWAMDIADSYGSRASLNRHVDSAGATLAVASAATMVGLVTLGSGTSPWLKGLPVGTGFAAGIMTVYANQAKAEMYTAAANYSLRLVNNSDRRIEVFGSGASAACYDINRRRLQVKTEINQLDLQIEAAKTAAKKALADAGPTEPTESAPAAAQKAADQKAAEAKAAKAKAAEAKAAEAKAAEAKAAEAKAAEEKAAEAKAAEAKAAEEKAAEAKAAEAKAAEEKAAEAKAAAVADAQTRAAQSVANEISQRVEMLTAQRAALQKQLATWESIEQQLTGNPPADQGDPGCSTAGTSVQGALVNAILEKPSTSTPTAPQESRIRSYEALCLRDDIMEVKERVDAIIDDLTPANIADSLKGVGSLSGKKLDDWIPTNVIDRAQSALSDLQGPIVSRCGVF